MQKVHEISYAPVDSRVENTLLFFTTSFFHFFCAFMNLGSACVQLSIYFLNEKAAECGQMTIYYSKKTKTDYIIIDLFNLNVIFINCTFLSITACFHIYYAYYKIKYNAYISPSFRWFEYGIITPIMFIQVCTIGYLRDIFTLVGLTGMITFSMLLGYIQDKLSGYNTIQWFISPHEWGYFPYFLLWGCVYTYLFILTGDKSFHVESYVISTIYLSFFSQTFFAVIQYYFVVIPFKKNYERVDDTSILEMDGSVHFLSLITKMLQAWIPILGIINL